MPDPSVLVNVDVSSSTHTSGPIRFLVVLTCLGVLRCLFFVFHTFFGVGSVRRFSMFVCVVVFFWFCMRIQLPQRFWVSVYNVQKCNIRVFVFD